MTGPILSVRGDCATLAPDVRRALCDRRRLDDPLVRDRTAAIIDRVRADGDAALRELALEYDGVSLDALEVPMEACARARAALDPALRASLDRAAANIRAVHEAFRPVAMEFTTADGVVVGRRPDPLARVGVYAPGGRASYPSSLLMGAVPARVAGVREVIACSPPGADGRPSALVLAAASIAGVDRLFAVGGAGAVAAMALGTASVPQVDHLVGPGNAWVTEAKLQLARIVGIDSPAGPSELLIIADGTAAPGRLANEMLAQAEHDPDAAVALLSLSDALVGGVSRALEAQLASAPRAETIRQALRSRGAMLTASTLDEAIDFANDWAGEHVLLALRDDEATRALARLRNGGTIFTGAAASVAFGDYLTGANHVLPTGGHARTWSGLSTDDFVRWTSWQRIERPAAAELATDTAMLATAEGLPAHARAARAWGSGA